MNARDLKSTGGLLTEKSGVHSYRSESTGLAVAALIV
jgi:hypothetical protein